jgi:type II secretory pathway component PulF
MNYRYRAMTQDGQKLQGIIDANDERQARLRLREEGLFLLDIRPQKSSGQWCMDSKELREMIKSRWTNSSHPAEGRRWIAKYLKCGDSVRC